MTPEEYEQRMKAREARKKAASDAREAQHRADMIRLDDLEQEHGDGNVAAVAVAATGGLVIVRRPTLSEYERYKAAVTRAKKPQAQTEAQKVFARKMVVHPELAAFDELAEESPGVVDRVAVEALKLADLIEAELEGKP